ncbi:MAG: DUF4398 domain-containing protein [Deltaproteobacteria bacterium]|nr:DUF4398 domain-containing protein [Deltaproteobacteria bacterium]
MRKWKLTRAFSIVLCFGLIFLVFGCTKPPKQELENAEKAINSAKSKEAHIYAEETFKKAEEVLNKAKTFITEKKYKEAKQLLIEAEKLAKQAETEIEAGKAKMKEETEKMFTDIKTSLEETKKLLPQVIRKKIISKDDAQNLVGKWELDFSTAKESLEAGKIKEAKDKAKSLLDEVKSKSEEFKK